MSTLDMAALAARVDRLEREGRRWRRLAVACAATALALAGWLAARPRVVGAARQEPAKEARQEPAKGAEAPEPGAPADPLALIEQQRQMAIRALKIIDETANLGAPVPNPATVTSGWSFRLLGAELYRSLVQEAGAPRTVDPEVYLATARGAPDPGRVASFQAHLDRMRRWEQRFRPLFEDGRYSALNFLEIQARRIQAEQWLSREQNKPGPPG